ncbi:MAG TPA: sugar ABC transporter ATP-binding protein [Marmoricola sp.]
MSPVRDRVPGDVLVARDLTKRYGGVVAISSAGITLRSGQIHALVGENGAGKSTLVKILCGVTDADSGTITLDDAPVSFANSREAGAAGVALVAQELSLFPDLSVRENLFPLDPARRFGLISHATLDRRAAPVLERLGLDVDTGARLGDLTIADQQLVEIAKAMLRSPRVLILDEPTSALPQAAVARLDSVLHSLADDGLAVLYISHFLEEVMRVADRITVMRDSRTVLADAPVGEIDLDRLVSVMIGEDKQRVSSDVRRATHAARDVADLRLVGASLAGALHEVDLNARRGEIVGVAGLQGSGHTVILDAVCGRVRLDAGEVLLPGGVRPKSMRHAYANGVAFVPSDRKGLGLMLDRTVAENISSVAWLGLGRGGLWQRSRQQRRVADQMIDRLRIRGVADTRVGDLSGGNQQKVVFAKWMATDPKVLVLDDPTRGVDIGARAEMHDVIKSLAGQGRIVLVASTDLAELCEVCDRVAVFQRGRLVRTLVGEELDEATLSTAMNAGFAVAEVG